MRRVAQHMPCLALQSRDATLCGVCACPAPLPYRVCRGCSHVPSWHHGRCSLGDPEVQINAPKQAVRGYERVLDTTYRQETIPDLVIDHPTSVDTSAGISVPLLEQDELCLVRYGTDAIIRMAIEQELKILPGRMDQSHGTTIRDDMIRYSNDREKAHD